MTASPLIEFKNITKTFGAVTANSDISFSVEPGTLHGIIGENGAGKSTAMKMLFGLYRPDSGQMRVKGHEVSFSSPTDAMQAGIGMVHQHFMLAEPFSALDNIILHDKSGGFLLRRKQRLQALEELARSFGFTMNLSRPVAELPVGLQQRVEILKILSQESDIIILDEPTAVLTPQEVEALFANLKKLKALGKTILIITHKLKEVMNLTDRVTVFRQGQVVAERRTADTNAEELAELMIGHRLSQAPERITRPDENEKILTIEKLSTGFDSHYLHEVSLEVRAGEIVGIAGVEGNGQDVLIRSLLDPLSLSRREFQGKILLKGHEIQNQSASAIREKGVGAFPEDRLRFGVLAQRPVYENFLLGLHRFREYTRGPFLNKKKLLQKTAEALQTYDIRPRSATHLVGQMSGGNQQKLVVARELSHNPSFILAAQPTRGVDIGAIDFIHSQLRRRRDEKAGILLISSELDELLTLSDRILVLFKGRLVAAFSRAQFDALKIGAAMGGSGGGPA
jgi:simple sugar transport system ATP-binding protein